MSSLVFRARWRASVTLKGWRRRLVEHLRAAATPEEGADELVESSDLIVAGRSPGSRRRARVRRRAYGAGAEVFKSMRMKVAVAAVVCRRLLEAKFRSWKRLMRTLSGLAAFRRLYTTWAVGRIVEEWRACARARVLARKQRGRAMNR